MTLSMLGRTVLDGQRITITLTLPHASQREINGYLAGMDDDAWFVLAPNEEGVCHYVVQRASSPVLEIHPARTYAQEPRHREMDKIIVPFRTWLSRNVFGRS
jgi:hypothetical protein